MAGDGNADRRYTVSIPMHHAVLWSLLACSGPGAGQAIRLAILVGIVGLGIHLISSFILAWRRPVLGVGFLVGLGMIHPHWWVSPVQGDCGEQLEITTMIFLLFDLTAVAYGCGWIRK